MICSPRSSAGRLVLQAADCQTSSMADIRSQASVGPTECDAPFRAGELFSLILKGPDACMCYMKLR